MATTHIIPAAPEAASDLPLRRLIGIGTGRRAIDVQKHIAIERPVEEVFAFFHNFESLPRFMSHLKSVSVSDGRSHWVLDGPVGIDLSWNAEIASIVPSHSISWRSIPGSTIRSGGIVRFQEDGPEGTRVELRMSYNPPGGAIGHAIAKLFALDPKKMLDDDLVRLKSLLERWPRHRARPAGNEGRAHHVSKLGNQIVAGGAKLSSST